MGENISPGMNMEKLASITHDLRHSNKRCDPPVEVFIEQGAETRFHVHDGKHRFVAHYIAGRRTAYVKVIGPWMGRGKPTA